MKETFRNILIIFLFCLVVFLTLVLGFVLGMKYSNNKEEVIIQSNKLSEDKLYEVSMDLYKRITGLYVCGEVELQLSNNKINSSEFSRDYMNRYVVKNLLVNKDITGEEILKYNISTTEYENEFKRVFGENVNYEKPDSIFLNSYYYTLSGDNYIPGSLSTLCGDSIFGEYDLMDYNQNDDKIELTIYLFHRIGEMQYVLDRNITDLNYTSYTKEEILNNHKDKIIKYKYTFRIDNDNYIFESIERV